MHKAQIKIIRVDFLILSDFLKRILRSAKVREILI